MTSPDHPLPAAGGSYIRNEDGSLTLVEPVQDAPPSDEEATIQPTIKRGGKAPAKEG